ncbi:TPA: hypothetical protein ACTVBQ_004353 [Klebsiella oxytoca]|uniref:hypothetical protein n=1 Tax=Klebsiella oxytoca TaxID=571 RepID=UPI00024FE6D8|nr:hypothetical protein [Klebsiella oxytoca]EHT00601.1 hypothetical protein HMPREF9689_01376 [Klebsiella oxytoca 10-5245]HAT3720650.1 hypothetical protein [Klebsiella oxytoca]HBL6845256.1 hypothetical protein [Klebsiella oxytoca]HCJ0415090.1 hypothetical protein [Klebsiella oxytoca]
MIYEEKFDSYIIDREKLPLQFPTHRQPAEFWEQLGRTVATFGFLEEVLGKAIFAFTATRNYSNDEIEDAYKAWIPQLERALTDQLWNLAESYGKSVRLNRASTIENIDGLVDDIKAAAKIRNVLCHGSWHVPDADGKITPLFFSKQNEKFSTPIDIDYFHNLQRHVMELICAVIDSVTHMGWQFPGGAGPGEPLIRD